MLDLSSQPFTGLAPPKWGRKGVLMRLLMQVEYTEVLFGPGAPIAEIIAAIDGAKIVNEEGPYDKRKYVPKKDANVRFQLLADDSVALPEVSDNGFYETYRKLANERDELRSKVKELEKKLTAVAEATKEPEK